MFYRKDAVFMAVAGLLACSGYAMADSQSDKTKLSLSPSILTADDQPQTGLIMMGLDKVGMAKPLTDYNTKIYGWVEGGYTYLHRHHGGDAPIIPGPFDTEVGNHFMLNQLDLRFEKTVDSTKLDWGGMIEVLYGTDGAAIHSNGLGYGNAGSDDRFNPQYQFDIPQAYIDVNVPVGNGLKFRVGKFVTLLGYETIDPRTNNFYSHSWLFSAENFTNTGVLASYNINDQWSITAGFSRGWDQALIDNNAAIDTIGQVVYKPNKSRQFLVNWSVGPENPQDSSHYRTAINPIITWQVTDAFSLAAEGLYIYDGGMNAEETAAGVHAHAYGDNYGAYLYPSYVLNDYVTLNGRFGWYHSYSDSNGGQGDASDVIPGFIDANGQVPALNVFDTTIGVTIHPMPKDPIGRNLVIRPEIRYQWCEDHLYTAGGQQFKDQLTFGADFVFQF